MQKGPRAASLSEVCLVLILNQRRANAVESAVQQMKRRDLSRPRQEDHVNPSGVVMDGTAIDTHTVWVTLFADTWARAWGGGEVTLPQLAKKIAATTGASKAK